MGYPVLEVSSTDRILQRDMCTDKPKCLRGAIAYYQSSTMLPNSEFQASSTAFWPPDFSRSRYRRPRCKRATCVLFCNLLCPKFSFKPLFQVLQPEEFFAGFRFIIPGETCFKSNLLWFYRSIPPALNPAQMRFRRSYRETGVEFRKILEKPGFEKRVPPPVGRCQFNSERTALDAGAQSVILPL